MTRTTIAYLVLGVGAAVILIALVFTSVLFLFAGLGVLVLAGGILATCR